MTTGRLASLIIGSALAVAAHAQTKGTMVNSPVVNAASQATVETTRITAVPTAMAIIIIDPGGGGGTGGGGTGGPGGTGGTGTGGTGTGGTGTGGTGTTGGGTTGPAGSIPADGILAQVLLVNPGDTTPNYPYNAGTAQPYKGPVSSSDPALSDLAVDMASVTGSTATTTNTTTPTAPGCVCCGAAVHTELIHDVTPIIKKMDAYVAYQVWHVDHYSGNFWHSYHHSNNTCVGTTMLGDVNGFALPAGAANFPTAYDPSAGCTVPWGTQVPLTEGPAMPSPFSNPPWLCPQCGRHDDSWGEYLIGVYKVKITLPVTSTTAQDRWAVLCANGHDQALPCDGNGLPAPPPPPPPPPGGGGPGGGGGGTGGGKILVIL